MKPELISDIITQLSMSHSSSFKDMCEHLCTIVSSKEDDCLDSNRDFLCLVYDDRFDHVTLKVLKPYVCSWVDDEPPHDNMRGYGWVNDSGHYLAANSTSPIVDWEKNKVLAFKLL